MATSASRRRRKFLGLAGLISIAGWGCGTRGVAPSATQPAAIGAGGVAQVGHETIPTPAVVQVAQATGLSPSQALDRLVEDALLAEGARKLGYAQRPAIQVRLTRALARAVAGHCKQQAASMGAPTQAEVDELAAKRWVEVDLPESLEVVHAVVLRPSGSAPSELERARLLAEDVHRSVKNATTPVEFEQLAKAFVGKGPEVRVEFLPPFVRDGRIVSPAGGDLDPDFVRAAFDIKAIGGVSNVAESKFGFHVIRLIGRRPEKRLTKLEQSTYFEPEVLSNRSKSCFAEHLEGARKRTKVERPAYADELLTTWNPKD